MKSRILLIEDDSIDQRAFERLMKSEKPAYDYLIAGSVGQAKKYLASEHFDIVVSDYQLPDGVAMDVLKLIVGIPVIIATGVGNEEIAVEALKAGAADYLIKDHDRHYLKVLPATIERTLKRIADRREAEEALLARTEELARSRAELEQLELFAFVASHDLQEPLHKLITLSELLKSHASSALDEKGKDYLGRIRKTAERMRELIDRTRDFARIAKEGSPFEPVDLESVVRETVADFDVRLGQAGGKAEIIGKFPTIEADKMQMHQLFQNLISNAVKFRRREVPPVVTIRAQEAGPFARLLVEDNGIGFEEKYLDRIFKPFQRLHASTEYEGSGIGLAICEKIVLRHGGKITATSVPGRGSVFTVILLLSQRKEG